MPTLQTINAENINTEENLTSIKAENKFFKPLSSPVGNDQPGTRLLQQIAQPQSLQQNDIMAGVNNSSVIENFSLEESLAHQADGLRRAEALTSVETKHTTFLAQTLRSIDPKESILAVANALPDSDEPLVDAPIELLALPAEIQLALLHYLPASDLENLQGAVRTDQRHLAFQGCFEEALINNLLQIQQQLQTKTKRYSKDENIIDFRGRLIKYNIPEIKNFILDPSNVLNYEALIKDLQFYLAKENRAFAQRLLTEMLTKPDSTYDPLIFNLIELGIKPINKKTEISIGQKIEKGRNWCEFLCVWTKKWTPLLSKLLSLDSVALEQLIFDRLPEEIGVILSGISDIHDKMLHDTSFKYDYKLDQIAAMRLRFLEKLSPDHHYIASSSDKRFLEKHLLEQIATIDNLADLQKFREEKSRLYLMQQHRHPIFDAIRATFFKPAATTLEQRFLAAIARKNLELGGSPMMVSESSATVQEKRLNDSMEETFTRSYLRNRPLY